MEPTWLTIARAEIGTLEIAGPRSNERIDEYLRTTRLPPGMITDRIPWCSAFVGWCLRRAGVASTGSAAARSYLRWGHALMTPRLGCVVVLTRPGSPGSGHVGFWLGDDGDFIRVLGGNQANQVCERKYRKSRVLSYRWPD